MKQVFSSLLDHASGLPVINDICLRISLRRLRSRQRQEQSLDDILDTTEHNRIDPEAVDADAYAEHGDETGLETVSGEFTGVGRYRVIKLQQSRQSITELLERLRERDLETVVEIGSAKGGTFYLWSRCLTPDRLVSIDTDLGGRERFFKQFDDDGERAFVFGNSHSSETVAELEDYLDGESVDFLYIDGDHSYEGAKRDFELYSSLVAEGGVIGLHDIGHPGTGVPRLWEELTEEYETEVVGESLGKNGLVYV